MRFFTMYDSLACHLIVLVMLSVLAAINDGAIIKEKVLERSTTQGRQKRNQQSGGFLDFHDFISSTGGQISADDVHTPSPISEDDADCFIEVERIEVKPGKCKTIGRAGVRVCSAGEYLSINDPQCEGRP
ncbi:uncharacterized protein LOC135494002 [Lineus longissimus]|uniref:uncharacterized protein LOC135494002 n=1 Tax=Lineus longissimus TaxID=88925 RepID=UPI002B4F2549